jgi:hypothetical protein
LPEGFGVAASRGMVLAGVSASPGNLRIELTYLGEHLAYIRAGLGTSLEEQESAFFGI